MPSDDAQQSKDAGEPNTLKAEEDRIRSAYAKRERLGMAQLYGWHRREVQLNIYRRGAIWTRLFQRLGCSDLAGLEILDVGCGNGSWLRQIQEWGADPARLHGIDFLAERIDEGKKRAPHIDYRVATGWGISSPDNSMDIVMANTVFSSILDPDARSFLANEMIRVIRPGGTVIIYDFRFSNPRNKDVTGIGMAEMRRLFPAMEMHAQSLNLAPPLARKIAPWSPILAQVMEAVFPFLRSHAVYGLRHPAGAGAENIRNAELQ